MKLPPVTVREVLDPTGVEVGFTVVIDGPEPIVKFTGADVAPLVDSVTGTIPGFCTRFAGMVALAWLPLTNAPVRLVPLKVMVVPTDVRPPVTVTNNVKDPDPAVTLDGVNCVITGITVSVAEVDD